MTVVCSFQGDKKEKNKAKGIIRGAKEIRRESIPLRTYSEARYNRKQKQQDSQSSSTQSPHSSFSSAVSGSLSEDSSCTKHRAPSEIIDLLQEISAEQLLIEPEQMCSAEDLGSLNHNAFQERLGQNTQENKVLLNLTSPIHSQR